MKKTLLLVLAALLCITSFTGCGKDKKEKKKRDKQKAARVIRRQRAASVSNLKQIGLGIMMYSCDFEDYTPAKVADLTEYLGGKKKAEAILASPCNDAKDGYIYCCPPYEKLGGISVPSRFPVAFENPAHLPEDTDEISVLYADGHVGSVKIKNADQMTPPQIVEKLIEQIPESYRKEHGEKLRKTVEKQVLN